MRTIARCLFAGACCFGFLGLDASAGISPFGQIMLITRAAKGAQKIKSKEEQQEGEQRKKIALEERYPTEYAEIETLRETDASAAEQKMTALEQRYKSETGVDLNAYKKNIKPPHEGPLKRLRHRLDAEDGDTETAPVASPKTSAVKTPAKTTSAQPATGKTSAKTTSTSPSAKTGADSPAARPATKKQPAKYSEPTTGLGSRVIRRGEKIESRFERLFHLGGSSDDDAK